MKLHAGQREAFKQKIDSLKQEIDSLKSKIQDSRKLERMEIGYLSELAKQYSAEASTDFPDQETRWQPPFPKIPCAVQPRTALIYFKLIYLCQKVKY